MIWNPWRKIRRLKAELREAQDKIGLLQKCLESATKDFNMEREYVLKLQAEIARLTPHRARNGRFCKRFVKHGERTH